MFWSEAIWVRGSTAPSSRSFIWVERVSTPLRMTSARNSGDTLDQCQEGWGALHPCFKSPNPKNTSAWHPQEPPRKSGKWRLVEVSDGPATEAAEWETEIWRSEPASWLRGRATDPRPLCFPFQGADHASLGAELPIPVPLSPRERVNFLWGGKHHRTHLEKGWHWAKRGPSAQQMIVLPQESGFHFLLPFRALISIFLPYLGNHVSPWNSQSLPRSGDKVRGREFY